MSGPPLHCHRPDPSPQAHTAWRIATILVLTPMLAHPAARPTHAALRKAYEANLGTVVEVIGPRRSGAGVVVGAEGHVVTSVEFVGLEEAKVRFSTAVLPARVLAADARLKVSVLKVDLSGTPDAGAVEVQAAPVRLTDAFRRGDWLVGINRSAKGKLEPVLGQVTRGLAAESPFIDTDLPLSPGSPLFDAKGKLVAIAVQRRKVGSRALPLPEIKLKLLPASEAP